MESSMKSGRESSRLAEARSNGLNHATSASIAGRLFFPHAKDLGIEADANVSPGVLKKTVHAGSHASSFRQASKDLDELAEVEISTGRVRRATEKIGTERVAERDADVQRWQALTIPRQQQQPASLASDQVPQVACVQMDGGRLQIRGQQSAAGEQGEETSARETSGRTSWREDKVGICLSMTSEESEVDPHPQIPRTFVDPTRMNKLAREIKNAGKKPTKTGGPNDEALQEECDEADAALTAIEQEKSQLRYQPPKIASRTVVATRRDVDAFGPMLAAMAWMQGFAAATRKAFLADGSETNWSVWSRCFSHYTPILDFVHALCYVYHAAMSGLPEEDAWTTYCQWAQWVWSGKVQKVIAALEVRLQELGGPPVKDDTTSPQAKVAEALRYLTNQQSRMKYDEYRRRGLPITSSHIESTIKQINRRVKGSEKFWDEAGAEALLQLTADYLSDTMPLTQFWQRRQQNATGQRSYSSAA
jgi:hypothetical protein